MYINNHKNETSLRTLLQRILPSTKPSLEQSQQFGILKVSSRHDPLFNRFLNEFGELVHSFWPPHMPPVISLLPYVIDCSLKHHSQQDIVQLLVSEFH